MIASVSYYQSEILKNIMKLCNIERFCADVTYGNGKFYGEIEPPEFRGDIAPQVPGVIECSSSNLPVEDLAFKSLVFDPPFLTYVRAARDGNGNMVMAKRFGGYWR